MGYFSSIDPMQEYFQQAAIAGGFSAAPRLDLGENFTARELQIYLNELGYKGKNGAPLVEDNLWKTVDQEAMSRLTSNILRQQSKSYSAEASGTSKLFVFPDEFARQIRSKLALTPRAKNPTVTAPAGGSVSITVLAMQKELNRRGFKGADKKALKEDGVYGANTVAAFTAFAAANKVPKTLKSLDRSTAQIDLAAYQKLTATSTAPVSKPAVIQAAKPVATTPKPATAARTAPVAEIQRIVVALGEPKTKALSDGLWGKGTEAAWIKTAKARGLDATIVKIDGKNASVNTDTFTTLSSAAGTKATSGTNATTATSGGIATSATKATTVADLQRIVVALGAPKTKALSDGLWGNGTQTAWISAAKARGLDTAITKVDGKNARVNAATYAAMNDATKAAPASGMGKATVADLQRIVVALGAPKSKDLTDGLWGKTTQGAWADAAKARKLDATIEKIDGKNARVNAETFKALNAAAKAQPGKTTLVPISVADVQRVVVALGAPKTKALSDGLWGKGTEAAWANAAQKRKLDPTIEKIDGKTARVSDATLKKLEAEAKVQPAKPSKPADKKPAGERTGGSIFTLPPDSVLTVGVKELQRIVVALGAKSSKDLTDGLWGSTTEKAWKAAAAKHKLSGRIQKVDGKNAAVLKGEFQALDAASKQQPSDLGKPKPVVTPKGVKVMIDISRGVVPTAVNRLRGVSTLTEKSSDAELIKAWKDEASKRKLDPEISFPKKGEAKVEANTVKVLSAEAMKKPAPVPAGLVNVLITTVQKAANGQAGKAVVDVTGKWNELTQKAAMKMLTATAEQITQRLTKKKSALRLEPSLAKKFGEFAKAWDAAEKKRKDAEALKSKFVTVRMDELQKALNASKGYADDKLVPITGKWDAKTKAAYLTFASVPKAAEKVVDSLVQPDKKAIKLSPDASKRVETFAAKWESAQAQQAAAETQKDVATNTTTPAGQQAAQEAAQTSAAVNAPAAVTTMQPEYVTGQAPVTTMNTPSSEQAAAEQAVQQQQQQTYSNVINFPGGGQAVPPAVINEQMPPQEAPPQEAPVVAPPAAEPAQPAPAPSGHNPLLIVGLIAAAGLAYWYFVANDDTKALPAETA